MKTSFFVPGVPRPQGSKDHVGNGRMVESSKGLAEWRWRVGLAANQARSAVAGRALYSHAVRVDLVFVMPRPKRLGATLPTPPHIIPPDTDKLIRGVLDGLTGTLMVDDALVIDVHGRKRWAEPAEPSGCLIVVESVE